MITGRRRTLMSATDRREYMRQWRAKNRAHISSYMQAYNAAHKEQKREWEKENRTRVLETRRKRRERNAAYRARQKTYMVEWYAKNAERRRAYARGYHKMNQEQRAAYKRWWRAQNSHKHAASEAKRDSAKLQRTPSWLNQAHLAEIEGVYHFAKVMERITGKKYHVDHIEPLQGRDVSGLHVPWNLRAIPASENLRKHNRRVTVDG